MADDASPGPGNDSTDSDDKQYIRELRRAFQAEVFGEAGYAVLSRLKIRPGQRAKFAALRELEARLKTRLGDTLAKAGFETRESWLAKLLGGGAALAAAPLPWQLEARLLRMLLEVTVPAFERFERKFGARDPELARSLSAHERAQLEFFRREIAGDAAHALDPVRDLLET